ncbi:tyrosine-type recombinase/integrase [Amorphus orientalis]|uniref:Integrase n=1 Tax=Amorphus orientalis TaxID=649198 RepID=A0AAE3VMR6_9HYPH|nr:hypothetical protein [Amorphus orientalis]MDQ0314812.1 integrase [Amorphus orientalis]
MPLEIYDRDGCGVWWVRGRPEGGSYIRRSLGTSDRSVAEWKAAEIERKARRRSLLGDEALAAEKAEFTFRDAVLLYDPTPADARFLIPILKKIGDRRVADIKPAEVKDLARELLPNASTDTWQRQVITPTRSVINNAHERGRCPPIRIKAFTRAERVKQDQRRGKQSRVPKIPGDWEWINAFRSEANPYLGAMALFMFTTAARITQATLVTPDDLDLPGNRVWLQAAKGHDAQWVDISPQMVAVLANLPPRRGRVFGYKTRHAVYGSWKRVCKRAGIGEIMPHAAGRHGFATETVVRQKVDPASAAMDGRWSSTKVLLDTYSHGQKGVAMRAMRTEPVQDASGEALKHLEEKAKKAK